MKMTKGTDNSYEMSGYSDSDCKLALIESDKLPFIRSRHKQSGFRYWWVHVCWLVKRVFRW